MAEIKPFYCVRPAAESASRVAALPYDVTTERKRRERWRRSRFPF